MGLAVENVDIVAHLRIEAFDAVVFVGYLAHDLLQNILKRNQSHRRTVFVHHDGHVHLVGLELLKQIVDLLVFGHIVWFAQQRTPVEIIPVVYVGNQVLHIQHTLDVVGILLVDRNPRKTRPDDRLLDIGVAVRYIQSHDIYTRFHDAGDLRIDEVHNPRQHLAFLLCLVRRCDVNDVREFVDRDIVTFGIEPSVYGISRAHQHERQRFEYGPQKPQRIGGDTCETHR